MGPVHNKLAGVGCWWRGCRAESRPLTAVCRSRTLPRTAGSPMQKQSYILRSVMRRNCGRARIGRHASQCLGACGRCVGSSLKRSDFGSGQTRRPDTPTAASILAPVADGITVQRRGRGWRAGQCRRLLSRKRGEGPLHAAHGSHPPASTTCKVELVEFAASIERCQPDSPLPAHGRTQCPASTAAPCIGVARSRY